MPRWPNMARNGSRHSSVIMKVLCPTPILKASYCPGFINCSNRPLYGSGFRGDNVLPSMIFLFLIVAPAMAIDTVPSGFGGTLALAGTEYEQLALGRRIIIRVPALVPRRSGPTDRAGRRVGNGGVSTVK